jgi:methyl-accepting chemotaxis protein
MDQVTQQNAALVEEASAAAHSMAEQAQGLRQAVAAFKVDEDNVGIVAPASMFRDLAPAMSKPVTAAPSVRVPLARVSAAARSAVPLMTKSAAEAPAEGDSEWSTF